MVSFVSFSDERGEAPSQESFGVPLVSFEFLESQQVPTRRPILTLRNVPHLEACAALEQIGGAKAEEMR